MIIDKLEKSTELKNKEYNYLLTSKDEQVKILSSEILISKQEKIRLKEQEAEISLLNERIQKLQNSKLNNGDSKPGTNQIRSILEISGQRPLSKMEERTDIAAAISSSSSKILNNSASKSSTSDIPQSKSQENSKIYKRKGEVNDNSSQSTPIIVNKSLLYSKKK